MSIDYHHFNSTLLDWFDHNGRKDLPWKTPGNPYVIWVSEIMLQQTQVKTVIPYFLRFITRFPTIDTLAEATENEVLAHWSGLGYYSRGRNLHRTAIIIKQEKMGVFPTKIDELVTLPGIGQSTAAAILSQAFDQPTAIMDANVKRVLSRYFKISGDKALWELAHACMPQKRCADYTQAIMDFGALCCTNRRPSCTTCPLKKHCAAYQANVVDAYPPKKQKKILPIKHEQFLLFYKDDKTVFLEKRPPTGIWGGLWCLPTLDQTISTDNYDNQNLLFSSESKKDFFTLKHTFSHFQLHIHVITFSARMHPKLLSESNNTAWVHEIDLGNIGLPKPVSTILKRFFSAG